MDSSSDGMLNKGGGTYDGENAWESAQHVYAGSLKPWRVTARHRHGWKMRAVIVVATNGDPRNSFARVIAEDGSRCSFRRRHVMPLFGTIRKRCARGKGFVLLLPTAGQRWEGRTGSRSTEGATVYGGKGGTATTASQ